MQTGSSGTLIGLKSGQTMHVCPSIGPNEGSVAMDSEVILDDICIAVYVLGYFDKLFLNQDPRVGNEL
jgi:hypothetical protein